MSFTKHVANIHNLFLKTKRNRQKYYQIHNYAEGKIVTIVLKMLGYLVVMGIALGMGACFHDPHFLLYF